MCYFDQTRWSCGYWRWGHFRQQCNKEYRMGETCGLKLVYETRVESDVCKLCHDTEKKQRRYRQDVPGRAALATRGQPQCDHRDGRAERCRMCWGKSTVCARNTITDYNRLARYESTPPRKDKEGEGDQQEREREREGGRHQ